MSKLKDVETNTIRVGYSLNQKKLRKSEKHVEDSSISQWKGGGLADIIFSSSEFSDTLQFIKFSPIEKSCLIADLPVFDIIIHKLTEDLEQEEPTEKISLLNKYLELHPNTVLIDPLNSVLLVTSRLRSSSLLNQNRKLYLVDDTMYMLTQPNYFVYEIENGFDNILDNMRLNNISFPIICKPVVACGSPEAHLMSVVVSAKDLSLIKPPCIIQQYLDHNNTLYKVYVLGDDVMVFKRPSLPNLSIVVDQCSAPTFSTDFPKLSKNKISNCVREGIKSVVFDSRLDYPTDVEFNIDASEQSHKNRTQNISDTLPVPLEAFKIAAEILRNTFHLSLFGFDVIFDNKLHINGQCNCHCSDERLEQVRTHTTSDCNDTSLSHSDYIDKPIISLTVVDVNYFPSYKEVHDFPARLRAHIENSFEASKLVL